MLGYKAALQWLLDNDDCHWLDDDAGLSVTASLVADIYGKTDAKVRLDLRKARHAAKVTTCRGLWKQAVAAAGQAVTSAPDHYSELTAADIYDELCRADYAARSYAGVDAS